MFNHLQPPGTRGMGAAAMQLAADPATTDDGTGQLRDLAGQVLTAVAVLAVIAGVVTAVLFLIAKVSALSKAQSTSLMFAGRVFLASSILGSVGGLIYFGSGLGKFDLMPEAARPPTIDVTKNPAKSTCTDEARSDYTTSADAEKLLKSLLSDADVAKYLPDGYTTVRWTPKGPDCTSSNLTPDPCKKVKITYQMSAGAVTRPQNDELAPRNSSECKN